MKPMNTFYDTLQVSRSANEAALQAAYQALCAQYHPDKDPEDLQGASPEMLLLSEAYAVLSDSEKRFAYDLSLTKREREMRAEEEAKAAKAASSMFPPIVMPPDLPELPSATPPNTPHTLQHTPAPVSAPAPLATSTPAPVKVQPSPAPELRRPTKRAPGALDFEPTTVELPRGEQSGFADTQPQVAADPQQVCTVREVPVPVRGHPAVEWLRERPLALLGVVVLGVALVALAPWAVRVFHIATQSKAPVIEDLHPTYVEPALAPAPAASAVLPPELPALAPETAASQSNVSEADGVSAAATGAVAAVAGAAAVAQSPKAAQSPKRVVARKTKPAAAPKAPEGQVPTKPAEPAPASPVLDPGGHSGFAPKCRWVTPTKWSCD